MEKTADFNFCSHCQWLKKLKPFPFIIQEPSQTIFYSQGQFFLNRAGLRRVHQRDRTVSPSPVPPHQPCSRHLLVSESSFPEAKITHSASRSKHALQAALPQYSLGLHAQSLTWWAVLSLSVLYLCSDDDGGLAERRCCRRRTATVNKARGSFGRKTRFQGFLRGRRSLSAACSLFVYTDREAARSETVFKVHRVQFTGAGEDHFVYEAKRRTVLALTSLTGGN